MRRLGILLAIMGLVVVAIPAGAEEHEPPPTHPHMLVLGLELDANEEPVGYRKCVDLAANRKIPLNAHHAHLHTGTAGEKLFTKAGHAVVPGAPITPWSNCEELIAFFFGE